ncbi:MAG: hypothetical protein L0220_02835 [Acidobacteria bacterium]|nr:hypothetical protein [Acidobacteriota bacterium]
MSHKFQLTLNVSELNESISISGEFTDDEWEILELFLQCSDQLSKAKFLQSDEQGSFRISWEEDKGLTITTTLPHDWDEVIVFLHKLRPLILKKEITSFHNIRNLLGRKLDHSYFKNLLKQHRQLYSGKVDQSIIQVFSNDVLINSENVLFDWLNAHEYHRISEKREFLDSLHQMLPLDASKVIFLGLLLDKATAIFELADLARVVMNKQKSLSFNIRNP